MPKEIGSHQPEAETHSSTEKIWAALARITEKSPNIDIREAVTTILEAFGWKVKDPKEQPKV